MEKRFPPLIKLASAAAAAIGMLVGFSIQAARTYTTPAQECMIEIGSPKTGSHVRRDALVSGTARIPANGHLWILAHKKGVKGWWPQGGGEADVKDEKWEILVSFGKSGEIGNFEIAAVVVDKSTNDDLKRWVEDAPRRDYPPISFPNPFEGCPFKTVSVEKVGD